jgi:CheY-like chemotaxis protein
METKDEPRLTKFLLVEDDDDHATIVMRSLRSENASNLIDRATDGVEAIQYLRGEGRFQGMLLPDVILLDLKLPKKDGHEVLAEIKQDERLRVIPIIVLSTSDAETDRMQAYRLHANSYLVKPLSHEYFKKMIQDMSLYWGNWNLTPRIAQPNTP